MEVIEIKNLSFAYPEGDRLILDDISLSVDSGDFILICGESGCGKTTLLRHMIKELTPFGSSKGQVINKGVSVGFVMQDPDSQIVTDKVWHELAFGLENLGMDSDLIKLRCGEIASFFGISGWYHKNTDELSGGQKQMLNLASVLAMKPDVIVIDEPLSQLDPLASEELINAVVRINRELGIAVVISEHSLNNVMWAANKVVVMDKGKIIAEDKPQLIMKHLKEKRHKMQIAMPCGVRIHSALTDENISPLTFSEAKIWLESFTDKKYTILPNEKSFGEKVIKGRELFFAYKKEQDIIKNLNIEVNKGEVFAILGGNGSGKTTLLRVLAGLSKNYYGNISIEGKALMLPQNPIALFTERSVLLDLKQTGSNIDEIVDYLDLKDLLAMNPNDLSGGELQRCAIAKLILSGGDILLLDEPTKGIDAFMKKRLGNFLRQLNKTIVIVSHDVDFCGEFADRCALLFDGRLINPDYTHRFFADNFFYTTNASKVAYNVVKGAVTCEEVINALGGREYINNDSDFKPVPNDLVNKREDKIREKSGLRTVVSAFIILFIIPFLIWAGMHFLNDRKYYVISLAIIGAVMVPFFMIFESRRIRTREIVIAVAMCAMCVAGRIIFAPFPQIKPVSALVIISGVCLGGETGFMAGALSGFCSNFYFGQGPWTPWQMFAFGIIGFLSGVLRKCFVKSDNTPKLISISAFGFLSVMLIYGVIMNSSSVLMYEPQPTVGMIIAYCTAGLPFDFLHAFSTVVFLCFLSEPVFERIIRIKKKFGVF